VAKKIKDAQHQKDLDDLKSALQAQKDATLAGELEITKAIGDAKDKNSEFLVSKDQVEIQAVKDKYFKLLEMARQQGRDKDDIDALEIAKMNEINDINLKAQDENYTNQKAIDDKALADKKANDDAQKKIDKEKAAQREQFFAAGASSLKQAASLLGESTDAGKAAAIAAATIETYQSAVSSYNSLSGVPIVGPALGVVAAGVAVAAGIANVKKILAVKTPKGGGGGGGAPTGGAPSAPSFNVVGNSGVNQLAGVINNKEQQQAPIQAYVVANDVTTAQSVQRNIIKGATLG
jgi:hypothetical protein